jgi:hypothetical protein
MIDLAMTGVQSLAEAQSRAISQAGVDLAALMIPRGAP